MKEEKDKPNYRAKSPGSGSIINQKTDPSTNGSRTAPTTDPTEAGPVGPAAAFDELSGSALDEADEDGEDDAFVAASADASAISFSLSLGPMVGAVRMLLGMLVCEADPVCTTVGLMLIVTG